MQGFYRVAIDSAVRTYCLFRCDLVHVSDQNNFREVGSDVVLAGIGSVVNDRCVLSSQSAQLWPCLGVHPTKPSSVHRF
jgi:hypothetical protein